jgi:hypothetical protein
VLTGYRTVDLVKIGCNAGIHSRPDNTWEPCPPVSQCLLWFHINHLLLLLLPLPVQVPRQDRLRCRHPRLV